jgi:CubicO group peptidase (beta-lactamase class C family)
MNAFRNSLLTALLVLCSFTPARADKVDDYVARQLRALHIPGLSLAVVRDGRIIKAQGYGVANIELNVPAASDTVYEIGSMTKQFTATAIMMLVEEGKVSLDDKLTKYFRQDEGAPEAWSRITVRHLLTHMSGIQNHVAAPDFPDLFHTNLTRDSLVKRFFKLPLEFQPGETWAYDNTGYYLLGIIIEKASGKSFWQFLDERIFQPLGMTATRSTDPLPLVPNRAAGYEWQNNKFEIRPVLTPFVAFSAGALLSSIEDMAKWDAALYTEKLLKKSSFEQMWTPAQAKDGRAAPFSYGFGWFIDTYHGHRLVQHSGGTPGFSSTIYRFVDDELTIIILTNHADRIVDQLAIDIAGDYVPALKRPEGEKDPDPLTSLRLKGVTASLLKGKYDPASYTPQMHIFLNTATGQAVWKWFASHGELKSFSFSDCEDTGDVRIYRYQVVLGENPYWFSFKIMRNGRIAQIYCW